MGILYDRLLILLNESSSDSTFYHIALTMLQNMELLHSLAINEVADLCSVSKSTISKFIRALGYEDYAEFREAARLEENKYHVSYNFSVDVIGYLESHSVQEYTQEIAKDIRLTAQQLDWDAVDRLVDDLIHYKKVFALGMMFSSTAAINLQIKLGRCGKFIVAPRNDIQQMDNVARADEDTLLIVFSESGQYLNRYDAIEDFYDKGIFNTTKAKTVLITSDEKMAHDPRVAYSILFHRGGNVHTHRTTFPFVTDMIAWRYYEKSHKNR